MTAQKSFARRLLRPTCAVFKCLTATAQRYKNLRAAIAIRVREKPGLTAGLFVHRAQDYSPPNSISRMMRVSGIPSNHKRTGIVSLLG
jgi:hypothetical protein